MEDSACDAVVDVDALRKRLRAQARVVYGGTKVADSGFYICSTLETSSVRIDGSDTQYWEERKGGPFKPHAKQVRFTQRDFGQIDVGYLGLIDGPVTNYNNYIGSNFVLLTDYAPWYPMPFVHDSFAIRAQIRGLDDYTVMNARRSTNEEAWILDGPMVLAYRNNRTVSIEDESLIYSIIFFDDRESAAAQAHVDLAAQTMAFYQNALLQRRLPPKRLTFFRPEHAVNDGWSFIRDGITVCGKPLSEDNIEAAALVSHELAHTWSCGAPLNWEDWLNESFAEYGSILFIEDRFGSDAYRARLELLIEANKRWYHMEPIRPASGDARPNSVHTKGPIVFDQVRTRFGYDAILALVRSFDRLQSKSTQSLLTALRDSGGMGEIASFLESRIREPF